jgi:hypothetical protein
VAGTGSITTLTVGTCTLTASRAGDANWLASAPSAPQSFTVSQGTQATVTLAGPADGRSVGEAALMATAGGGSGTGAYSYASSTTNVCTVDANSGAITTLDLGTCTLTASRAGDANWLASAPSAPHSFTVTQ